MAQCPVCQANIEDDFGLVTCVSCGAQVLMGDSQPQVAPNNVATQISNVIQEDLEQQGGDEADLFDTIISSVEELAPQSTPQPTPKIENNFDEVASFGNQTQSQGRDGLLRYNLVISGIDSTEIRKSVEEALQDDRFLWEVPKILTTINRGELNLRELTAVKAAIVVQRLRAVPVTLKWEQHAIY